MRRILAAIAVLSTGVALPVAAAPPDPYAQADSANRGLYVALRVCAACHAVAPLGEGPDGQAPRFAVIGRRHDAASLRRRLRQISVVGHREMPPIPLTPREIEDVATYIASVSAISTTEPATPIPASGVRAGLRPGEDRAAR